MTRPPLLNRSYLGTIHPELDNRSASCYLSVIDIFKEIFSCTLLSFLTYCEGCFTRDDPMDEVEALREVYERL